MVRKELKTMYLYGRVLDIAADKALDHNSVVAKLLQDDISIVS